MSGRTTLLALALLLASPPRTAAQAGTAELLQQARQLYERLEIERALPLLRQVVSSEWPLEVTTAQRVEAYKYLGAALALREKQDSAILYFRAALERDAFADLDATQFTPAQVAVFAVARRRTFSVGARPVAELRLDPRTERLTFTVVTTHAASLRAGIRAVGTPDVIPLFEGSNTGVREITWDCLDATGRLAAPNRYELALVGRSDITPQVDSLRVYFDLRHQVEPLEDTIADFRPGELLLERHPEAVPGRDLLKGLGVAVGALAIAGLLGNDHLGTGSESRIVAGAAAASGVAAFFYRRSHREIPANVAINEMRRAARARANQAIRERNADRLARTVVLVAPAAGTGPGP